ncbi:MAG: MBL fold metallo-hydrolase [Oscillospiraceae bacterium]
MVENVIKNIFRIDVPLPGNPLKTLNSYFIKGSDRNLLIDTGFNMDECRTALLEGLRELGADMFRTDIYVTHLHSDHIGLADVIASPESKVFLTEIDHDILIDSTRGRWERYDEILLREGFSKDELEALVTKNPARAFAPATLPPITHVKDGDVLNYGGLDLEVIEVTGHTPGNTVLYVRDLKLMFLGDHVLFDITPNIISWMEVDNSLAKYCDNLRKIREYDVSIPLPAHRTVTCTMRERIDQILEHHKNRLNEALSVIKEQPGLNLYDIASKMTWQIRTSSNKWEDFPIGQKFFAIGETLSHMEYLIAEGKAQRRFDGVHNGYWPS